jgi:hypothetical protein
MRNNKPNGNGKERETMKLYKGYTITHLDGSHTAVTFDRPMNYEDTMNHVNKQPFVRSVSLTESETAVYETTAVPGLVVIETWGDSAGYYAQCEKGGYVYMVESENIDILNIYRYTENESDLYMPESMVYSGTVNDSLFEYDKPIYKLLRHELERTL